MSWDLPLFDQMVVARTAYMEARGEGVQGMTGVAWVIRNRVAYTELAPAAVCLWPAQFSCWHPGPVPDHNWLNGVSVSGDDPIMAQAYDVARLVFGDTVPDPTGGATHYLAIALAYNDPPSWFDLDAVTVTIGRHIFLKLKNFPGMHHASLTQMAAQAAEGAKT